MEINNLIENFSIDTLKDFFRAKLRTFKPDDENYEYLFEDNNYINDNYQDIQKIGEANFSTDTDDILIFTAKTLTQLTNRTGKKKQYEIAKKILKEENKDAAFFIFYDGSNFRFSFIRANFLGTKRNFTSFKRYTYFVDKTQTNKTFITQISKCDFNSLDSIQKAFSVEPVTKEFYEKLQCWYAWALKNVEFPKDAEEETNGREVAVIRLITRLMFIWFMKVRDLIPNNLFDEENVNKILKDFSQYESTYYKAILQNLFFATLNTRQKERRFLSEKRGCKGFNADYGNHNVYRYQSLFKDSDSLEKLFSKIPFLNGGLFECLDYKTKSKDERKYIDGFTAIKGQQPKIPNFLFFSGTKQEDLSKFFGKKNKTYKVQGLIKLLKNYNFTIDENEPDDVEVALDPELLGSIFENLLASYNPETATTARKATGSFYTPREIVNYMTDESLKQYFKTNIADLNGEKLDSLISSDSENLFNRETTKKLINLINDLRVVDPAVGSGAFPMAMLNRLVFILAKLDPENKFWRQSQIDGVKKSVTDPIIQHKLVEQIKRQFKEKNADYGRKLYLIEKCIYGVDIQQIAVEIAKLRFFISLLVDEQIDKNKENSGIEPLPNLEFKLMQGNSLISEFAGFSFDDNKKENLEKDIQANEVQLNEVKAGQNKTESEFMKIYNTEKREDKKLKAKIDKIAKNIKKLEKDKKRLHKTLQNEKDEINDDKYKNLIKNFEEIKTDYQNEADNKKKKLLREKIDKAIIKIVEGKISTDLPGLRKNIEEKAKQIPNKEQRKQYVYLENQKLTKKFGFDIEQTEKDLTAYTEGRKAKDFFLWNIYFAEVFSTTSADSVSHPSLQGGESKSGFDIVIGNPPYINVENLEANLKKSLFEQFITCKGRTDIYIAFIEKAIYLLKHSGILSYIIPYPYTNQKYGSLSRKMIIEKYFIREILDTSKYYVFETAVVKNIILSVEKCENKETSSIKVAKSKDDFINNSFLVYNLNQKLFLELKDYRLETKDISHALKLKTKIWKYSIRLDKICLIAYGARLNHKTKNLGKDNYIHQNFKNGYKPFTEGKNIDRYSYTQFGWLDYKPKTHYNPMFPELFENEKLFFINVVKDRLRFAFDKDNFYNSHTVINCVKWSLLKDESHITVKRNITKDNISKSLKFNYLFLLGILNSNLINWYFLNFLSESLHFYPDDAKELPIPNITFAKQKPFETLVNKIIAKKERGEDTTTEEQKIDLMVYKLYELTHDEVRIVDSEFGMSKQEYENYG